jgi:hypothetical protein
MPDLSGVAWGILFDLVVNGERHRSGPYDDIGMSQEQAQLAVFGDELIKAGLAFESDSYILYPTSCGRLVVEALLKTYEMRKTK